MSNIVKLTKLSLINLKCASKQLLIILGIWGAVSIANPDFLNIFLGMGVYIIIYQLMAYEDMAGIDNLISVIPIKRTEYVISRYIFGAIVSLGVIAISLIIYSISPNVDKSELSVEMLLIIGLTIAVVSNSIIIPVTLKMGIKKGQIVTMCFTLLITMGPALMLGFFKEKFEFGERIIEFINSSNMYIVIASVNIVILIISIICAINFYKSKEIK